MVSYDDILAARERIGDGVIATPCIRSLPLSELTGCNVYCKLEYLQRTGSFKERGARNALLQLNDEQRGRGVIAASAGNHALGLAWHGQLLGIPVTVVMPSYAPQIKIATCRRLGAKVVRHGETFAEARAKADEIVAAEGRVYVHGYDDPAVIAGQGTIGLEILEQVPQVEAIVIPIGGGGLIAGIALAVKERQPGVKIIGVEAAQMPTFKATISEQHPVKIENKPTLADGLAVSALGANAFEIVRTRFDKVIDVDEALLALSVLRLLELEKSVVEGAGAASLAGLLSGQLDELRGKNVVILLSGGNIDPAVLGSVIDKGLVADGRLIRLNATISDRPGGLARFATAVAQTGASIREIAHDRAFNGADLSAVSIICTLETDDADHAQRVMEALQAFLPRQL